MQQSRTPLAYLRSRSNTTKHTIALLGALLPALLVGYGQYYMRHKQEAVIAKTPTVKQDPKTDEVSVFAAFGKILTEGKAAVGDAAVAVKKFNQAYLNEKTSAKQDTSPLEQKSVQVLTDESAAMIKENK